MDLNEIQRALEEQGNERQNAVYILEQLKEAQRDLEEALVRVKYKQSHIKIFLENFDGEHEE